MTTFITPRDHVDLYAVNDDLVGFFNSVLKIA